MSKKYLILGALFCVFGLAKGSGDKLFPDMDGWNKNLGDKVYTSENLWQLINGAADIFLTYNFEDLHIAEYENNDEMIRVELYRHKTVDDTYGIYSAERMPDYPQVSLGTQGYKSEGVVNFFAGNYYVKIMSAGVKESDEKNILLIAEKVQAKLNQPTSMPAVLKLFPEDGMVYLSDSYIAQNFMGYSFFHHAFVMKYENPAGFQMFIIYLPDQVQQMTDLYIKQVKIENVKETEGILVIKDQFNGTVFLKQYHGYLIGVMNTESFDIAKDYINKSVTKI